MKKFLMLFFSFVVLAACSSDDDAATGPDPILGTWVLVSATFFDPAACENKSVITFNQDNTATGTFYLQEANCEPQSSDGAWQNLGNSNYSIVLPLGELRGTANFSNADNFVFTTSSFGSFTFRRQ